MLKRIRMFFDLTVNKTVSNFVFNSLLEKIEETDGIGVEIFYLSEDKPGLKDICIRIEGFDLSSVTLEFNKCISIASKILKEVQDEFSFN